MKVFVLCCEYAGYLLRFKVYLVKDAEESENYTLQVVDWLINNADFINYEGRILYSNN